MTEDWSRWYRKDYPVGPEACFVELSGAVPPYIKNVIDFGCGAGRNLALFDGKLKLWGVDLPAAAEMEWRIPFQDLTYVKSRLQSFSIDRRLDDFLCISHGTIMYLDPAEQRRFLGYLIDRGCKNFILQEYDEATLGGGSYHRASWLNRLMKRSIGHPFSNPFGFEKRWFRDAIPCWIRLDDSATRD